MGKERFASMLAGGKPNSLGRTVEVVEAIFVDGGRLDELLDLYALDDEQVRLRASNALKRVTAARPDLVAAQADRLLSEVAAVDQVSARWTLAQVLPAIDDRLTAKQRTRAKTVLKRNLDADDDWLVLTHSATALHGWAANDPKLATWLRPRLERLADDRRPAVAKRAAKLLATLGA